MFRFYKLFPRFRNKTPQSIKPLKPLPPSTLMNEASRTHRDSETEMRLKSGSRTCTYLIPVPSLGAGNHCLGGRPCTVVTVRVCVNISGLTVCSSVSPACPQFASILTMLNITKISFQHQQEKPAVSQRLCHSSVVSAGS